MSIVTKIKDNKKKIFITLISIALGMVAGYAYYYFIGCNSGSCGITSSPFKSTLFGGVFGYLLTDSFKQKKELKEEKKN